MQVARVVQPFREREEPYLRRCGKEVLEESLARHVRNRNGASKIVRGRDAQARIQAFHARRGSKQSGVRHPAIVHQDQDRARRVQCLEVFVIAQHPDAVRHRGRMCSEHRVLRGVVETGTLELTRESVVHLAQPTRSRNLR